MYVCLKMTQLHVNPSAIKSLTMINVPCFSVHYLCYFCSYICICFMLSKIWHLISKIVFFENLAMICKKYRPMSAAQADMARKFLSLLSFMHNTSIRLYFMLSGRISRNSSENIFRYYTGTTSENTEFHVLVALVNCACLKARWKYDVILPYISRT